MYRPWIGLLALLTALGIVMAIWTSIDRRPAEWDYANHLGRALDCYRILSEPGRDRLREIIEASAFYPPVVQCAAGLLYFVFPVVPLTAQAVMLAYLAVALIAVFALGARLWDPAAGLMAAFLLGTAPFVVFSLLNFQLDLPLMAMVALALYALVCTDHFSHRGWSIAFGVAVGLGMVTKPPFAAYVLPPLLWAAYHALRAPDRRRRLGLLALALGVMEVAQHRAVVPEDRRVGGEDHVGQTRHRSGELDLDAEVDVGAIQRIPLRSRQLVIDLDRDG